MTSDTTDDGASAFYDDMWKSYGHLDAANPASFHRRRLAVQLARKAAPRARRLLDAGCGQGELLADLTRAFPGSVVEGADLSEQSLRDTARRSPGHELFLLDLVAPDFRRTHEQRFGRFDLVVCSEVLEHIPDDALAARNLMELLAPGAVALITVPGGKMSRFDELIGHQRHYSRDDLVRLLEGAGFQVDRAIAWGFPFHNLYRTAVRVASRATMAGEPKRGAREEGGLSRVLGKAYALFGRSLKPLFYLNAARWGEQTIAVARRPER